MTRLPVLFLAALVLPTATLLTSCSTPDEGGSRAGRTSAETGARRRGGALDAARDFVDALNTLDADRAASHIAWDLWVAEDARLKALLHALRAKASKTPPSPQALAAPAIKGSDVPLRDVLASENPSSLVAAIAKDRFKTSIREDFAPDRRTMDAKLVSWHLDRVERSATLWMPNGEQVQMLMFRRDGAWKLVPRW